MIRRRYPRRSDVGWLVILLGLALGVHSLGADPGAQAQQVTGNPDITYHTSFVWQCSEATWERILDEPLLMGRLWEAYGYAPAYKFSARGDTLHVDDPTGLKGDVLLVSRAPGARTYVVLGQLDHWAVPFFNEGIAVFVLTSQPAEDQICGDLKVYVRASSTVGNLLLQLGRPLLAKHIDNRITLNLQDGRRIVERIAADPAQVAALLRGPEAERFKAAFLGEK